MSVDNNAILYVGLPLKELAGLTRNSVKYVDPEDYLSELENKPKEIGYRELNTGETLVGIDIGDSGSYGCITIDYLPTKIKQAEGLFFEVFKKQPKVYLFNLQW